MKTRARWPQAPVACIWGPGMETDQWSYDGIYRLTNEAITGDPQQNNGGASYSLDPIGNRLSVSTSLTGLTSGVFSYNADDEVSSETYDANGNATQVGAKSFTYDSENHMMTMSTTGTTVSLIYDGDGNRVGKSVNGVPTWYLVDDLNPTGYPQVFDELTNGVVTRTYTYGLQRISEDQIVNGGWTPSFYGYDGGSHVRYLANAAGTITDTYEYDAFGNRVYRSGTTPNNYMYRGEQYDPDLSLYFLRARYYDPATGRFVGRDPEDGIVTDPATLHKYVYAGGDPVNAIDPSGRATGTATWGRPGIEYVGPIIIISFGVVKSAPLVAKAASCVFHEATSLLKGLTTELGAPIVSVTVDSDSCSAKVTKCKPCIPPVGTISCRIDTTGRPHAGIPTPHWQAFEMNQNPNNCQCFWVKLEDQFGACPAPPGMPPIGPAGGGGPW